MNVRKLNLNDRKKTRLLWEHVFQEDGPPFLDYYYDLIVTHNQIYGIEVDGAVQSMLHLNPYMVQVNGRQHEVNYIVGVATEQNYRRKGYMGELLRASIKDMYRKEEPFTFLMPAAESIYSPYDFVTVSNQFHYQYEGQLTDVDLPFVKGYEIVYAGQKDCQTIAELAMEIFSQSYAVSTIRDAGYYERLIKEQQCQGGGIALIKKDGILIGYFLTAKEGVLQVRELTVLREYEAFVDLLPLEIKEVPKIMVRIVNLQELLRSMKAKYEFHTTIELFDPIIPENTGVFQLHGTQEGIRCEKIAPLTDQQTAAVSISTLARAVFGLENLEGWPVCDSLSPVLLNEIV